MEVVSEPAAIFWRTTMLISRSVILDGSLARIAVIFSMKSEGPFSIPERDFESSAVRVAVSVSAKDQMASGPLGSEPKRRSKYMKG